MKFPVACRRATAKVGSAKYLSEILFTRHVIAYLVFFFRQGNGVEKRPEVFNASNNPQ
jgi:hypothetical protein